MCLVKFLTERKIFNFGEFFEGANMIHLNEKLFLVGESFRKFILLQNV